MDEKQIYIKDLPTKESPSSSDYLVLDDGTDTNRINYENFKSNVTDDVVGSLEEETKLREKADTELASSITNETSQRETGDDTLAQAISNESTQRESKDEELASSITDEISERKKNDNTLSESIAQETSNRKQADEELSDSISKEKSQRLLNVTSLENNINALKGVTVLVGDGETKVFTVNHNLSTKDLIVQAYLISGQDLSFSLKRDLNSFEITFDEAPTDEVRVIYIALNKWVGFKLPTKLPIK